MVDITDIERGSYRWITEESHADNTEIADDFIENQLPACMEIYHQDENYIEFILPDGRYFSACIYGDGDFTHHKAVFEFIK